MTERLGGVFAPVATPFRPDGAPDAGRLIAQIEIYAETDLAGIVLFGTSGEGPMLEPDEQKALLEAVRETLPPRLRLVVQIGREGVPAARALARQAIDAGADALLCLPPRFYATDRAVVSNFFRAVAGGLELPLVVYHIPQLSKVDLPAELILELVGEGVVCGIKDSAGDLALQARLRRDAGSGFALLDGKATVLAESLALGADGAILAVADAAPEAVCDLFAAHAAGDLATVRTIQERVRPLAECLGPRFGVAGIKTALDLRGWPGGGPLRAPLRALDQDGRLAVAAALEEAGIAIGSMGGAR